MTAGKINLREAVVAEKLEALVVLGDRNSRIKDFFDLHYLATRFEFDRDVLTEAARSPSAPGDEIGKLLGAFLLAEASAPHLTPSP